MTVIVRHEIDKNSGYATEYEEYKSIKRFLTKADIEQAEKLDEYLEKKFRKIYNDLENKGLLENGRGSLERWYALGKHLQFVDDEDIVPPEDRSQDSYIWEAFWHHAPKGVRPGPPNSRTGTKRDHFRECYKLAQIPYKVVESVGNWSDWVNFLETPSVMDDERIIVWVGNNMNGVSRKQLREFTKLLRKRFNNRVTEVLSEDELAEELCNILEKAKG
mgnify:CR=1 FL=1